MAGGDEKAGGCGIIGELGTLEKRVGTPNEHAIIAVKGMTCHIKYPQVTKVDEISNIQHYKS